MATFRDLLNEAKQQIDEVDTATAEQLVADGALLLDVREADEFEQGAVPGSVFIPRGHLEGQVEGRLTDKAAKVVVMCAGGVRSAFAARTLGELGYSDVVSMAGGFNKWKDEGRDWRRPEVLSPEQRNRYHRHLLLPEEVRVFCELVSVSPGLSAADRNLMDTMAKRLVDERNEQQEQDRQAAREVAIDMGDDDDDTAVDDNATVSVTEYGYWVQAWLWVSDDELETGDFT